MSDLNAKSAILKFINGQNKNKQYLTDIYSYITDSAKTDNGTLVGTQGCSREHPLEDIFRNKLLHNKSHGKQGEHFVISFPSSKSGKSPLDVLNVAKEIVSIVYPENMGIIAVHTDSRFLHAHVILDSVNAITGKKFSQSPSDLNRVKQKANKILEKYGFEIITASANDFVDATDYSRETEFDFLELDESKFITEADIKKVSSYTGYICNNNFINNARDYFYPEYQKSNSFGGFNMNTNNNNYTSRAPQSQESFTPAPTAEIVPSTMGTTSNSYPNTTVVTGPTIHIRCNSNADFTGLNNFMTKSTEYAQEHMRESANLALAMQQHGQQNGCPSNVCVFAGLVIDIEQYESSNDCDGYDDDEDMYSPRAFK